jgi:hypothetical protein
MAVLGSFRKWLSLKQYQLEVTFSVYMFTPWEKFFFSTLPGISYVQIVVSKTLIDRPRLHCFSPLQLDLHRRLSLPPASHLFPRRSRLVLYQRRAH